MSQAIALLWLAASAPSASEHHLVEGWASSHSVRIEWARPAIEPLLYSGETAAHIERELGEARVALDAGNPERAATHLDTALHVLRSDGSRLPEAPWLMAEALHLSAREADTRGDTNTAAAHRAAAELLEGARARTLTETNRSTPKNTPTPQDDAPATDETAARSVDWSALLPGDHVYWDGIEIVPSSHVAVPGLHHAFVTRDGRASWSSWITLTAGATPFRPALPEVSACSLEDLKRQGFVEVGGLPSPPKASLATRCPHWLAARPGSMPGTIDVAECWRDRCGAFETWPSPTPPPVAMRPAEPTTETEKHRSAPWWIYAGLGTALAATAGVILWTALDSPPEQRTVWRFGGVE